VGVRQRQKSRIAARARNVNTILLILVLVVMTAITGVIINGINTGSSMNLVRAYSMEAAEKFFSYISQDLTLTQKSAHSKAVTAWFADEKNEAKKAAAFDEMMDYVGMMQDIYLYFGIHESLNEYTIESRMPFSDLVSFGKLNKEASSDVWYFECIESDNDYTLKIDMEKVTGTWRLWINHKVMVDGKVAGVFCTGLKIPDIFHDIFGKYETQKVRGYIIDRHGIIQSDSTHAEIYLMDFGNHIREENSDSAFAAALHSYMGRIDGFFGLHSVPEVVKLSKGMYGYAAIEPVGSTDWSAVVLFNNSLLGTAHLLPLLITMLVALLLYVVARDFFLTRLIFTPLDRLTQSVSDGSAVKNSGADFYGCGRDDEIGGLARTIRDSALDRENNVAEMIRLQAELKEALKEAQDASSAKSTFLANMSHEMRTPLNAIIGLSTLTLETGGISEEAQVNLEKINSSGETLLSTVNDILDISKIEAGKFELVPVDYAIPSLINDAITQSIMRIGEKPIKFVLDINEDLPVRLYGDDLRIKQMLNNLMSNAFKYTKEGTVKLSIHCERDGETDVWMTASVSDTGKGIRAEDIGSLFSDYAKMDEKSNRKIEGAGLGLPITKKAAEMMSGSISVESEYGKGSVFTVRLKQRFVTDATIGAEVVDSLRSFHYIDQKRRLHSQLKRLNLSYAHVLVVDDVEVNLDVAKGMMKSYGMKIDCVTSGQAAIDAIRGERVRYNAVFMDHMMPGMDGVEAVRIIREEIGTEYAKTVPVIALTANAIVGNDEMFLGKGFQAFISKPIEIARLDAVIHEWVADKNREAEYTGAGVTAGASRLGQVDGIDLQKGLERFSRDEDSYLRVLRSYAENTPPLLEAIKEVDADNLAGYAVTVHGIKGASRGICAEAAGDKAKLWKKRPRRETSAL
jgi:signal transduction histidine kinase/CheY-like chemotaxis protein